MATTRYKPARTSGPTKPLGLSAIQILTRMREMAIHPKSTGEHIEAHGVSNHPARIKFLPDLTPIPGGTKLMVLDRNKLQQTYLNRPSTLRRDWWNVLRAMAGSTTVAAIGKGAVLANLPDTYAEGSYPEANPLYPCHRDWVDSLIPMHQRVNLSARIEPEPKFYYRIEPWPMVGPSAYAPCMFTANLAAQLAL